MINKPLALSLPLSIFVLVLVTVSVADFQPGLPGDARAELDRYLAYQYGRSGIRPTVRQVALASRPGRFNADMSAASYGDGPHYRTTNDYREPADPLRAAPGATGIHFFGESGRPLPFPPERLWCLLIDPGDLGARRLVFVALHQDLYNADWLLHESPAGASDSELAASLDSLGCAARFR